MKQSHPLPLLGIGPFCAALMAGSLLAGLLLLRHGILQTGELRMFLVPMRLLGGILIAAGLFLWIQAVLVAKIDRAILSHHLVTTGVYAWVRNPIYSAIALALTGIALLFANAWLLLLPLLFWLELTLVLKHTEERWLQEAYGEAYADYCRRVNRCIPWFPKPPRQNP